MRPANPFLRFQRRQIEAMIESGRTFGEVEDAIEATNLTSDEKSALWMLGWASLSARTQMYEAEARMRLTGLG